MRIMEKHVQPAREVEVCVDRACDLCGIRANSPNQGNDWSLGCYDVNIVEIRVAVVVRHQEGDHYPESQTGETFEPDICPECMRDKVVPALRALGLKTPYVSYPSFG